MKKTVYLLLLLVVSTVVVYAKDNTNDYDKLCQIYTEAYQLKAFKAMSAVERADYISNKISETLQSSVALDTLQKIAQVDPEEKYGFIKEAAELATGKAWDCPAMKNADLSY